LSNADGKERPSAPAPEASQAASVSAEQPRFLDSAFSGGDNIEKIREILFGVQMRRYEEMFLGLKERLSSEVADLRREMGRRMEAVEAHVQQELSSMSDRLTAEQEEQSETLRTLTAQFQERNDRHQKKLKQVNDQLTKSHRSIRRQLMEETERVTEDVRQKQEETLTALDDAIRKLHDEAIDRPTLSNLFQEMALRLDRDLTNRLNADIADSVDAE
jgi:Skp family chaperone for outer membrane proteins